MRVIDDLDAHVARFTRRRSRRAAATCSSRATAAEASAYVVERLPRARREARREVEVDGDGGDRPQRGARGGGRHARSRPISASTSSSSPASTPCTSSRRRSRRRRRRSPSCSPRVEGEPVPAELEELTRAARRQLRETFLHADVGITGANFGVCDDRLDRASSRTRATGGSSRSLPRVHVALIGMERLVADARRSRRAAAAARAQRHGPAADRRTRR